MSHALHSCLKVYTMCHTCGRVSQSAPQFSFVTRMLGSRLARARLFQPTKSRKHTEVCLSDGFVSYLFSIILILQLWSLSLSNAFKLIPICNYSNFNNIRDLFHRYCTYVTKTSCLRGSDHFTPTG